MPTQSALVIGAAQDRRLSLADTLRAAGLDVIEAAARQRAEAILRHFRFDIVAVDLCGSVDGLVEIIHDLRFEHPEISVLHNDPFLDVPLLDGSRATWRIGFGALPRAARIAGWPPTVRFLSRGCQRP